MNPTIISVRESPALHDAWRRFIMDRPDAMPYHRPEYIGILNRLFGVKDETLVALEGDALRGVLPLAHRRHRLLGNVLSSVPAAGCAGIVAVDAGTADALWRAAIERAERLDVDYLEVRGLAPRPGAVTVGDSYRSWRLVLADAAEKRGFSKNVRRGFDRARRAGTACRVGGRDLLADFFALYRLNMKRLGSPHLPLSFFNGLLDEYGEDAGVAVARVGDRPAAADFFLRHRGTIHSFAAGFDYATRRAAPNHAVLFAVIEEGRRRGDVRIDLGRSPIGSGSDHFKAGWGGEAIPYHYAYRFIRRRRIPSIDPRQPLYRLPILLWRLAPSFLTDRLGPRLHHHLA